jgi:superfamily II DNA/RNA helicase
VDDVELVIHVDPPTEHKAYLHRSGRTARAGSDGTVVTLTLPEQQSDVKKLMKAAGVEVNFERVTANSPLVAELVGEMADKIDPRTRAALLAAKSNQGGGTSTGANAERKRARRTTQAAPTAGGRGGRGGRGRVGAEAPRTDLPRSERRAVAYEGQAAARNAAERVAEKNQDRADAERAERRNARGRGRATAYSHHNDVPAAGGRASAGRGSDARATDARGDARGGATRTSAPRTGGAPRSGAPRTGGATGGQRSGRPATGQRAAAGSKSGSAGGNAAVWSSNTGGTSGGSYSGGGNGRSGEGRPARSGGPRRASAPASNERRSR